MKDSELLASSTKFNALMHAVTHLKDNGGVLIFLEKEENPNVQMREYGIGAQIVKYLGIEEIELLTATKRREFVGISGFGLNVVDQIPYEQ
jgi:3,4-dihydroxy 2-butanone 4-phosphate synthase/GTP cyclohydrolase II